MVVVLLRIFVDALLAQYRPGWSLPPKFYNTEALHRMVLPLSLLLFFLLQQIASPSARRI